MSEPPSKKSKSALSGNAVCISGTLTVTRKQFEAFLLEHGATLASGAGQHTAYLVCTHAELSAQTSKVRQAAKNGVPCVSESFVRAAVAAGAPGDPTNDDVHQASQQAGGGAPAGSAPTAVPSGKQASVQAARNVMLAKAWDDKANPTGWWISEKLDGVRAYWDGAHFYSRQGNPFPVPDWFKEGLPKDEPLDGELWCGRQKFRRALSIVKNTGSGTQWEFVTYLVFDAPERRAETYEERVAHIASIVQHKVTTPWAKAVGVQQCTGLAHLQDELEGVEAKGGEGLMLRQPGSHYAHGSRSATLLKVKSFHDEEAQVVAHEPSKSNPSLCGALSLETPDGRQFSCGSGLTDKDRRSPPKIGSVVTYRYTELNDGATPRFPRYVGPRIDLDWDEYCASYVAPVPPAALVPAGLQRQNSLLYTAKVASSDGSSSSSASSSSSSSSASPAAASGGGGVVAAKGKKPATAAAAAAIAVDDDEDESDAAATAMVEVAWEWRNGKEWVEYEQEDAALLESSFAGGAGPGTLHTGAFTFNRHVGSNYTVSFRTMTQRNLDSGTARKIRRIETRS